MGRLNEQRIQTLLKENKPGVTAYGDGSGLALRITPGGATWQLRYRHAGKAHWLTLGHYPDCGLKEAQKRATRERAKLGDGVDPVAHRRQARAALAAAKTFRELAEDYELRAVPDLRPATQKNVLRALRNEIIPRIGHLRVAEVTGSDIVNMVEQIGKRSHVVARVAFSVTSIVFSHGQAKHLAQSNPCAGLKLRAILGKKPVFRASVTLSEAQLREVLPKLHKIGVSNALAMKIALATAVRKGEIRLATWDHIDFKAETWAIPAANSKNGKAFVIPLAPVVAGWFQELKARAGGSPWILPGVDRKRPISDSTLNAALSLLAYKPHFTVHDLRRTARTHLGGLGVDVIVAERCLNHSLGGLVEIYDRGDYFEERKRALQLLADFIVRCDRHAENVVSLLKAG